MSEQEKGGGEEYELDEGEYIVDVGEDGDGGDNFDETDFDDDIDDVLPPSRKQTKAERERSEAAAYLLANKERVREMGGEEVDESEFPDMDNVRGPVPDKQETTDDYLDEFSEVMLRYNKDLKVVGEAVGLNRHFPDNPPYPFLPPDFARKLISLTPTQVHKWAMMCEAYTTANNAMEDVIAGGEVVKEGLTLFAKLSEKLAREMAEVNIDGTSVRIRARLASQRELTMRLYRKYVEPILDRATGGKGGAASDLLTLGMMFYKEADEQYQANLLKEAAIEAARGPGAAGPPRSRHEEMAAAVHREIEGKDEDDNGEGDDFDDELGLPPKPTAPQAASDPVIAMQMDDAMLEWQKMMGKN